MNSKALILILLFGYLSNAQTLHLNQPIIDKEVVFEEENGLVAVEAEYFYKQSNTEVRQWYRTLQDEFAQVGRDEDAQHCDGASNNSYIEILPDERITHSDKLEQGKNFTNNAGTMAVVHYKVKFNNPGRYYVWVRAFSTGTEDNGVHVGFK